LVDCQARIANWPELIVFALTCNESVGGGGIETVTVVDCVAAPDGPTHVIANVAELDSAPVDALPRIGSAPLQPPEAVHDVAPAADQVRIDAAPALTVLGTATRVTDGMLVSPGVL